jgi:hypothetical protein
MAKFTSHYGVEFADQEKDEKTGALLHKPWAKFELVPGDPRPSLTGQQGGLGSRVYAFETDDAKVAERVRKINDYGIAEVKD